MGLFRRKPSVDPAKHAAVAAEVIALRDQLERLGRRLEAVETDRRESAELVRALHQRLASIGTEFTNQFTELSGEIDVLQARPDPSAVLDAVDELRIDVKGLDASVDGLRGDVGGLQANVDDLATTVKGIEDDAGGVRAGQERLANEQARYQIAFREDLAALADQVARKRA